MDAGAILGGLRSFTRGAEDLEALAKEGCEEAMCELADIYLTGEMGSFS